MPWREEMPAALTSVSDEVYIGKSFAVIGERINPTGKPKLKETLRAGHFYEVLDMALEQKDNGAHILDVNVGLPGADEMQLMKKAIEMLSVRAKLPLSIDSSNPDVIEKALRIYPGRALVNSMSAKAEHINALLPLIRRYKPMFILLPIGEGGIPQTAEGRIAEIKAAYETIAAAGSGKDSILVDGLVMAVSSDPKAAKETLKVVRWCTENGFHAVGISTALSACRSAASARVSRDGDGLRPFRRHHEPQRQADDGYVFRAQALTERDEGFAQHQAVWRNTGAGDGDSQRDGRHTYRQEKDYRGANRREIAGGATLRPLSTT